MQILGTAASQLLAMASETEDAFLILLFLSDRFAAAIAEMLIQSTQSDLYLLPALPRDKWPTGSVKGLKARGDVTVDISWKEGELHEALLWSSNDQNSVVRLHYGKVVATVTVRRGIAYRFGSGLRCLETWPLCK